MSVKTVDVIELRDRLTEFSADVFVSLSRSDQRRKAELYLWGLLLDGRRKTMRQMAERLGIDHQGLQQFVTSSTWDVTAVRARLARRAVALVRPVAWMVDDVEFAKHGADSPCVTRQYARAAGKVVNCQAAVSVHLVGASASAPVNWRLFVPEDWDDTVAVNPAQASAIARRRRRCGIPATERHRPKWMVALEMLDELIGWGLRPPIVVAGGRFADDPEFRAALARRSLPCPTRLGADVLAGTVIRPAEVHRQVACCVRDLVDNLGLGHFEGRSWIGWNRHATLASAAHLFLTSQGG